MKLINRVFLVSLIFCLAIPLIVYSSGENGIYLNGSEGTIKHYVDGSIDWQLPLEGNYSSYGLQWNMSVKDDWNGGSTTPFGASMIEASEGFDRLLMYYEGGLKRVIASLSNGSLIEFVGATVYSGGGAETHTPMSLSRYYAEVNKTGSNHDLLIFKDTLLIQTTDLNALLSLTYSGTKFFLLAFSKDGKYLAVSGYTPYLGSVELQVALFKGS